MKSFIWLLTFATLISGIAACSSEDAVSPLPAPVAMTEEAVGHYCNMNVLEHEGPKAQIHLVGFDHPVWFTQVRDAIAYLRSPEEVYEARVVYVHDMSKADSWAQPGDGAWINAEKAWFVIGSKRSGGMGAPEAIPFGTSQAADSFVGKHGGKVVSLDEVPDRYVIGPSDQISNNLQGSGQT